MKKTLVHCAFDEKRPPHGVIAKVLFEPIGAPPYTKEFTYDIEPFDDETRLELLDRAGMEVLKELNAREDQEDEDEFEPHSPEFIEAFNKASLD